MDGNRGPRSVLCRISLLLALSGLLASCSRPVGMVLVDPALPVLDPEGAKAYSSFRVPGTRRAVRDYPVSDSAVFFGGLAAPPPSFVLLSPLLAPEYPAVRDAFPEALILGTGIPAGERSLSAAWDPVPAAREAGVRAGAFLRDRGEGLSEPPEAVILVSGAAGDGTGSGMAAEAFREGLLSARPDTPLRILELPGRAGEADALIRSLGGPGAKAVFLDPGAGGFRAVRLLAESSPGAVRGPRFTVLRSALPPPKETPADLQLLRDTRGLLRAFRAALKEGRTGSIPVPETLEIPGRKP